jgi:hypothetical protein
MGGKVTVQVRQIDGTKMPGARVLAINHDAWTKRLREWHGITDAKGDYTWADLETGALGDRYTFTAVAKDTNDGRWAGESSQRVRGEMAITLTVTRARE